MSLQNEFNLVAHAFVVGQLVKPSEPNDLETLPIGEDIVVGRFVKKLVDSTGCERIYAMATGDTVDSLFGITLNDNPTATRIDSPRTTYSYQRGDAVAVGRLSSKLSIRPEILVQDSTTDILNAPLYVVCGGDDSGKLLVADTDPTPSETTTYIALDHSSFNLRSEIDTGEVYLEITQIGKGGSTPYTLPIAKTNTLGGIKPDGTTITVDEETGIATATGTEPYELPIAKTNTLGGIKPDGITITVDEETGVATATGTDPYELPIAKTNTLGGIKPDGTTITVDEETGIATAVGGGSSPSPSDTPPLADDTADPGTADTYSRGDHVHPLIADATTNAHGLMSADDKVKLDALNNSIPIQLGVKNGVKVGITDVFGEEDVGVNLNEIRDSEWYEGTPLMVVGVGTDGHGKVFYKDLDESWHSLDVGTVNALESIDCFANTSMVFWLKHLIGGENTLLRITYEDDKFNVEDITANLGLPEFSIKKIRYVESIYDQSAFFLSIAGKGIYRSIDLGDTWELVYSEDENLLINDICNYEKRVSNYSVTVILAVGNAGKFIISSNGGSSWENGVSPDTGDLISIYCNRWNDGAPSIISTAGNGIFTSDDLENWTHILLKDGSQVKIRRLDEHEIYVAYGYKLVGSLQQYYFLFSEDGLTWNEEELPSSDEAKRLNSADESYSRVYLFGNNSKLLIDNARSLVKVIEGVLATNGTLGVVMPDGVTTQVIDGVMSAIGGQQDPTIMFGSQSIEFNQINLKYNKRLGSVPPHDGVKISSYYMIFLKDKAFIVKNLMTDYVFITTTSLEGTVNDYLCINEIMFAITDENTIAKWGNDKWNDYPMEDYSEIKFVSRKSFNYSSYYSIFFVSAKDSSGNYKLLKVDQYSLGTQDLNLNEEVVDVAVSSDGTIYALTPNALFTSKNPAGEGWTKFDDPDSLIKNANFIEIIEEKEYELIVITTSDGNVSVIESGQLFQIYEGNVPIVAVSALFFLLSDDSILRLGGEGRDPLPYETGINVEAISYVEDNLIAINQTTKYSIVGDTMIWCSLMSGYNISPISEGGGGAGNSDRFAREDHVHAFQMPIPYKLQKGDGINLTHQMQNVAKKNQFSGTFFKVLACEDKIIFCASSYIAIYNGLEYLSVDAQFTIKDFAYVNNQLLVIDENDKILYTQTQKTRWTKWNMPPDCVKCINVWAVKSTFFGLFQKEDESFVTARIGETYNSVYTTANEKISCIGELDDSRIILGGQTKYWFPITYGGDEQSHDLPSGITFKKVVRTPDWSIALATDSSKIFVSNDIWGGYVELDVGIPSQITDIYYESSLQLFIAATIDGYLYYEIEDGVSFVAYKNIKISDNPIVAISIMNQKIYAVDYANNIYNVYTVDIVNIIATSPSDTPPLADDTADPGIADTYSRGDHVHPIIPQIPLQIGTNNGVNVGYSLWAAVVSGVMNNLYGIAYGNRLFVAVGGEGTIITSSDGITWTQRTNDVSTILRRIAYGNELFVAVGDEGTIVTSPDGITWTSRISGVTAHLYGIAYGNGLFVAVGIGGTIITSPDGITWTQRTNDVSTNLWGIAYRNRLFVAVGDEGTIVTSPDGITWTSRISGVTAYLYGVAYGNELFIAVGNSGIILTSLDGITWTQRTSGDIENLYGIAYRNGLFAAVGTGENYPTILMSPDGITWITQSTSEITDILECICYGDGLFVAVGGSGTIIVNNGEYLITGVPATSETFGGLMLGENLTYNEETGKVDASGEGTPLQEGTHNGVNTKFSPSQWISQTSGIQKILYGIAYGNGLFVAVGYDGAILTSPDGVTWYIQSGVIEVFNGITYGDGKFVAVGNGAAIYISTNGSDWYVQTSGVQDTLNSITYGNGQFVAVGYNGVILTSTNGSDWYTSGVQYDLLGIAYGNGQFVAVGYKGAIFTSTNGNDWYIQTSDVQDDLLGITYGNGQFVAVGYNGAILTSTNGNDWYTQTSGVQDDLHGIAYGNGKFVAVGYKGIIITSLDGITWKQSTSIVSSNLLGITYGNGQFVAVGDYGTIITNNGGYLITGVPATANTFGVVKLDGILYLQNQVAELQAQLAEMRQMIESLKQTA